jgi:glycosyltransferase involved in cell wall biosynthesis
MKILFVSEDHSIQNYGVTTMLSHLADELVSRHDDIKVVIAATGVTAVPQDERVQIELIPPSGWGASWGWSPGLLGRLQRLAEQYEVDLIHVHGVWLAAAWAGLKMAQRMQIPAVLSVHGMWAKWFWEQDNSLKTLKKKLYFERILQHSISPNVMIHALNPVEKEDIGRMLPTNRIAIIPNAIHKENNQPRSVVPEKIILFLGRLNPIKRVELLIRGFAQAELEPTWQLLIAGPEEVPSYVRMLKKEVAKNELEEQVKFIGLVLGKTKNELIRKAWVQVLPSFSEGQAMTNLETATYGVPSITTFQAGLCDWQAGGGLLIQPDVDALTDALVRVCHWSLEERNRQGEQLRQWVIKNYSFDAIMPRWEKLYAAVVARDRH